MQKMNRNIFDRNVKSVLPISSLLTAIIDHLELVFLLAINMMRIHFIQNMALVWGNLWETKFRKG